MTGEKVKISAIKLLGYTDILGDESGTDRLTARALPIINLIYADLWRVCGKTEPFEPISSLADEINLPNDIVSDVMVLGVATLFAQSENDGDNQALWSGMYNIGRLKKGKPNEVMDVMPTPEN